MENPKIAALIIAIGVLMTLFLITLIAVNYLISKRKLLQKESRLQELENQKKIELIKAIVETEENQKRKIANDLHDNIITELTLKALNLKTFIAEIEGGYNDFTKIKRGVAEIAALSDRIREIVHGIIPRLFTSFGLVKSIEVVVNEMNNIDNSVAEFKIGSGLKNELILSEQQQLTLYITCTEILNNLIKHAHYSYLEVSIEASDEHLLVVFAHDGTGITNKEIGRLTLEGSGIGLKSIQSRVLSLRGKIDYSIEKGVSFVRLNIPLKNEISN